MKAKTSSAAHLLFLKENHTTKGPGFPPSSRSPRPDSEQEIGQCLRVYWCVITPTRFSWTHFLKLSLNDTREALRAS